MYMNRYIYMLAANLSFAASPRRVRYSPPAPRSMAVNPPSTPLPARLPHSGVAGGPAGLATNQLTNSSPHPSTSLGPSTWADVVRGEARRETPACTGSQPSVTAADFSALYQGCMASGLKARVTISHVVGCLVFAITCTLPVPAVIDSTAGRRCRCRRRRQRRGRAATAADVELPQPSPPVASTGGNSSQPAPSLPPPAPPPISLPEIRSPPAKRTRRRRNEVELL
jgi:hypothetical protein